MTWSEEEEKIIEQLGARIVTLRKAKGISQRKLSDKLDMDDGSLRRIESGRTNPTTITLFHIAKALDVEVEDLFRFKAD